MRLLILCLFIFLSANDEVLDFELIKMPTQNPQGPLVLIISGIQGDEPGGFNATNLLLKHYQILSGEVWVIPTLNKHSILRNHRGIYGDMNRKFNLLDKSDKEYDLIAKVKGIILQDLVQVVYHLHDGSGFYRTQYINEIENPNRWGNCSIIDQNIVQGSYYENLNSLSQQIVANINQGILKPLHKYHIRNTQTATSDKEMEKSLTYFAVRHHKTALANEASKNLPLNERVYYHLLGIEGMLKSVGVKFKRDFDLSPQAIFSKMYNPNSSFSIEGVITLPLFGLRPKLSYFPLPQANIQIISDQYIVGTLKRGKQILVKYGNRLVTTLEPLYLPFNHALKKVEFILDGKSQEVSMGAIVKVQHSFSVQLKDEAYRVNIIGFSSGKRNENNLKVSLKDFHKQYSIDRAQKKYRVEFYDTQNQFLGMIIVDFS